MRLCRNNWLVKGFRMESDREAILQKAYGLGFQYEKEYKGCCQCTLAAIQDIMGMQDNTVLDAVFKASMGLSGGICLTGSGSCGSLAGGIIAISYRFGREKGNFKNPEMTGLKAQELGLKLYNRFLETYGSGNCKDIQKKIFGMSFNLMDPFENAGAHDDKCPSVVGNAVSWTVEILLEQ
jgi:C_GCAxxG_C_C family probable redox protein